MKRLLLAGIALSFISSTSQAATKSPTPTPKATVKASVKPSATPTKKPVVKKPVYKPKPRKSVKVTPSPKAIWPPKGYTQNGDIYAKVPTSKELLGLISITPKLGTQLQQCETYSCGAILAGSTSGCNWWEFTADVVGPASDTDATPIKYGSLSSLFSSTAPKQVVPFLLISTELVKDRVKVAGIKISCHREPVPDGIKFPTHTYQKAN